VGVFHKGGYNLQSEKANDLLGEIHPAGTTARTSHFHMDTHEKRLYDDFADLI